MDDFPIQFLLFPFKVAGALWFGAAGLFRLLGATALAGVMTEGMPEDD